MRQDGAFQEAAPGALRGTGRTSQASVSAALAAANAGLYNPGAVRFPGEDGGRSLAEMAQRDLDAALQLLADRAQYITGAGGAAIALRRAGKNDLLCRASAGENAPELGALLSTEFGLSGESVRTRKALRCDDAERDARVNREVCRELGIASVVVMPVVDDDQVLGVFELFSGKANAFGERDLTALERLSQMVETAVRLSRAAESLPEKLEHPVAEAGAAEVQPVVEAKISAADEVQAAPAASGPIAEKVAAEPAKSPVAKPLFWSVALSAAGDDAGRTDGSHEGVEDQSHVPPVLRGLRKCEACGFPVSAGRVLCVECEEKKWRGQLKAGPAATTKAASQAGRESGDSRQGSVPASEPVAKKIASPPQPQSAPGELSQVQSSAVQSALPRSAPVAPGPMESRVESKAVAEKAVESKSANAQAPIAAAASEPARSTVPEFVLSSGLESSQSWFSANKYVLLVILTLGIGGAVAAFVFLR